MRSVGRTLQFLGLTILPLAMFLELTSSLGRSFGVSQMVIMLIFGMAAFYFGRVLEGYAQP